MYTFEKIASHPLVSLLEERKEKENFAEIQKEIFQKLPADFDIKSNPLFSTPGEDYFEWIDIVEAVSSAKNRFVMFELGAGYGRWCMNALFALKFLNPIPFHFVAVEAETSHFRFLQEYFIAHGLDLKEHRLIQAAVDIVEGHALFHMGEPNDWYGQYIDKRTTSYYQRMYYAIKNVCRINTDKIKRRKEVVKTISLNSILIDYDLVDLIDMDIQSAELEVLSASIDLLNQKVKRLHIGTHSKEIDEGLRKLFIQHGWKNVHLYPSFSTCTTSYGMNTFNDGVQSWINPRLE